MNRDARIGKIDEYGRGYDLLVQALGGIPRAAWEFKPGPSEWSIQELIIHMADSEMLGIARLGKLVSEPGSLLMAYDEAAWASALRYREQDADDALELFRLLRQKTRRLLSVLPDEVWTHSAVHPEWSEPYTMENWLDTYMKHVPEHVEQAKNVHRAWLERKP